MKVDSIVMLNTTNPINRSYLSSHSWKWIILIHSISYAQALVGESNICCRHHRHHPMSTYLHMKLSSPESLDSALDKQTHQKLRVAIIGGGVAGLSCASHLKTLSQASSSIQYQPIVFDTGRLRAGGRCSSRYPKDIPKNRDSTHPLSFKQSIVDHAAQILSIPTECPSGNPLEWKAFQDQLIQWETQGIIRKFPPYSIGRIRQSSSSLRSLNERKTDMTMNSSQSSSSSTSSYTAPFYVQLLNVNNDKKSSPSHLTTTNRTMYDYYYATKGMASIPQAIIESSRIQMEQDVWISPSNGLEYIGSAADKNVINATPTTKSIGDNINNKWSVRSSKKSYGTFDRVIIAHNGKCAFRLTSNTPATRLNQLLDTNFYYSVPSHGGNKMTLNSIYSLTFTLHVDEGSTSILSRAMGKDSFICAFIENEPNLKFITCQSRKFPKSSYSPSYTTSNEYEVWTILSSPQLGKQYKAPQENIPIDIQSTVTHILFTSLERCLNLQSGILTGTDKASPFFVVDSVLQLWGAAVPINTWRNKEYEALEDTVQVSPWETNGFIYDAEFGIGACGDWLLDPSIAGAWESGRRLARWMSRMDDLKQVHSVGLNGRFQVSKSAQKAAIGNLSI